MAANNESNTRQYCILFYKYHPLTNIPDVLETYRNAAEKLCTSLQLTGRILIGLSNNGEGINGTLAGTKDDLDAYVHCMLGRGVANSNLDQGRNDAVTAFREASKQFFARLNQPELFLKSPNDFKWSSSDSNKDDEKWFPDLNIKIVKEIISTGGAFADISTKDTSVGYLTPKEWHEEMQSLMKKDKKKQKNGEPQNEEEDIETILIDVRNHKECQIGAFAPGISIDPQTKTFAQFPQWVKENSAKPEIEASKDSSAEPSPSLLNNKRILMYCTGGIRCEKASAYIRQVVPQNKGIYHLKGGIHKYLEEFGQDAMSAAKDKDVSEGSEGKSNGGDCLFVGKNFVFDRRGALDGKGHGIEDKATGKDASSSQVKSNAIIGKCKYCSDPYDTFHPGNECTVCREPILVCEKCQLSLCNEQQSVRGVKDDSKTSNLRAEYHCEDHFHLKTCYFTSLNGFSEDVLNTQLGELQLHSKGLEGIGKKGKQKRRTLRKQMDKIQGFKENKSSNEKGVMQCRHCGSSNCASDCWGFHGGNTRMTNKHEKKPQDCADADGNEADLKKQKQRSRAPSNQRPAKRAKRGKDLAEIEVLQLSNPPSVHRNDDTGLRVPPPVIRVLRSGVKGRWCGKSVHWLLNNEFGCSDERIDQLFSAGLIRINGVAIGPFRSKTSPSPAKASDIILRNMDTIERIAHWCEPPICVPSKISLTKHALPENILPFHDETTLSPLLYCINKPSSVPIYPSGPYYANSLLMMVEAQEGLLPKTLIPLHRIDRATSGVLLAANMASVARVIQGRISSTSKNDEKKLPVRKMYLARVKGKFPANDTSENLHIPKECASIASIAWCGDESNIVEVNAPIAVPLDNSTESNEAESLSNAMMHRTVRGDGKHSISRFKLVSYDPATNESLVSCCPITGRGHQLRVHLQLIGFSIHNDVEYGGTVNAESREKQENLSVQSMLDASAATAECLHEDTVSANEVKSAIQLGCSGGVDGIKASFNSAQLLGCGHAIDLHALKYCISFSKMLSDKKKEEPPQFELGTETTASMEFSTDLPSWASSFGNFSPSSLIWLN